jgi:hypothetical protein
MVGPERIERARRRAARDTVVQPKVIPWERFDFMFARSFKQGEQVAIVGPNGSGKSVLTVELAKIVGSRKGTDGRPSRVVVCATKPRDDTITNLLVKQGWPVIKEWPPAYGQEHCVVWPKGGPASSAATRQSRIFRPLLDQIAQEGGQTVVVEEAAFFERKPPDGMGLGGLMTYFWTVTRSSKISLIANATPPVGDTVNVERARMAHHFPH